MVPIYFILKTVGLYKPQWYHKMSINFYIIGDFIYLLEPGHYLHNFTLKLNDSCIIIGSPSLLGTTKIFELC